MIQKKNVAVTIAALMLISVSTTCEKKGTNASNDNSPLQKELQNIMQKSEKSTEQPTPASSEDVKVIGSLDELNSIVKNTPGKLLVFDLYADWCMPCKLLAPTYDSIAKLYAQNASFYRVNVQHQQEIASAFRVQSIPLVVFIKDNEVVHSVTGLNPREHYEKVLSTCGSEVPVAECMKKLKEVL
jgi:thioredoxin 1